MFCDRAYTIFITGGVLRVLRGNDSDDDEGNLIEGIVPCVGEVIYGVMAPIVDRRVDVETTIINTRPATKQRVILKGVMLERAYGFYGQILPARAS